MREDRSSGPLAGIRVIDLSTMISGPLATMMLGDQGADVIKVEAPGLGDPMRMFGSISRGMSSTFVNLNRSKRSIVLNLRDEEGKEALRKLLRGADVLVQNFRPGVVDRMGFGYEEVRTLSPEIVYTSISGFGHEGPLADRPVYDNVIQALSGVAAVQADPETGKPELVRNLMVDKATAYAAAQAITAALLARARGGGGQHVRVSMLDVALAFLWPDGMMNHTFLEEDVLRIPPLATIYRVYETADSAITVGVVTDEQWARACRAAEREEMIDDPRFRTIFDRLSHTKELLALVKEMIAARTTKEWCARYEKHEVPHAPILSLDEVPEHPQVRANRALEVIDHPVAGRMRQALPAARFGGAPARAGRPAPALGEHTRDILAQLERGRA